MFTALLYPAVLETATSLYFKGFKRVFETLIPQVRTENCIRPGKGILRNRFACAERTNDFRGTCRETIVRIFVINRHAPAGVW